MYVFSKAIVLKTILPTQRRFDWYLRRIKVRNSFPRILFSSSSLFCPGVVWLLLASSFSVLSSSFLFFLLRQTRLSLRYIFSLFPFERSIFASKHPIVVPRSHRTAFTFVHLAKLRDPILFRSTPRLSSPIRCNRVSLLSRRENFQSSSRTNIWRRSRRTRSRRNVSQTRIFPSRIIPLAFLPVFFLKSRRHQSHHQSASFFFFVVFVAFLQSIRRATGVLFSRRFDESNGFVIIGDGVFSSIIIIIIIIIVLPTSLESLLSLFEQQQRFRILKPKVPRKPTSA